MDLAELIDPRRAALIVVDMQNDFCDSNGALARSGSDPGMIQAMAPRLLRLLDDARLVGIPIVHVRTEHSPWTDSATWIGRHHDRPRTVCYPGSWGADYFPGFEPRAHSSRELGRHEFVVTKHRYSGFVGTDLDLVLRSHNVRTVIMTGEATNVCVESTARDAFMRDYGVVFVSDCTASTVQAAHDATLFTMGRHFGTVATSDDVLAAWGAGVEHRRDCDETVACPEGTHGRLEHLPRAGGAAGHRGASPGTVGAATRLADSLR